MDCPDLIGHIPWWTAILFGVTIGFLAYCAGRLMRAKVIDDLRDQVKRWEIVADHKGWSYKIRCWGTDFVEMFPKRRHHQSPPMDREVSEYTGKGEPE